MVLWPFFNLRHGERTAELPHPEAHRDRIVTTTWDVLKTQADHHEQDNTAMSINIVKPECDADEIMTSDSGDTEKGSQQDRRAYLFLGKPMSVAHELAFFAVVSTSNFTPRGFFLFHLHGFELKVPTQAFEIICEI